MWSTCSADVDKEQGEKKENHQLRRPTFSPQLCGAETDGGKRLRWTHKWLILCFSAVEVQTSAQFRQIYISGFMVTPDNWTRVKVSPVMRKVARLVTPAVSRGPAPGDKHTGKTILQCATSQSSESWSLKPLLCQLTTAGPWGTPRQPQNKHVKSRSLRAHFFLKTLTLTLKLSFSTPDDIQLLCSLQYLTPSPRTPPVVSTAGPTLQWRSLQL